MGVTDFKSLVNFVITQLINPAIGVLAAIALVIFFWGIVRYIYAAGTGEKSNGRELMLWGIIALFVFVSIWGILQFLSRSLLPGLQ